jgi:hypothetical protein
MTRALAMLIASGIAGALLWAASRVHRGTTAGFWAEIAILAIAGLVLAIGRLVGFGATGRIRTTLPVLVIGFLPALVVGGWILIASQPNASSVERHFLTWSGNIHVDSVVGTLAIYAPVIAFGLGSLLGLAFERVAVPVASGALAQPSEPLPATEPTSIDSRRVPSSAEERKASTG